MQLRNTEPFSQYVPGDLVEVPDGAAYDPFHWEAAAPPPPDDPLPADDPPAPAQFPPAPKEM